MAPSPLVAALLCVLALTAAAPATAGPADSIFSLFWDIVLHENCDNQPISGKFKDAEKINFLLHPMAVVVGCYLFGKFSA